ncbi:MAG TPA: ATP-binding protein [Methanosarcinaceae archaeon]|nr:ATP-binding protein [Methanosarcinaceae archaeon]
MEPVGYLTEVNEWWMSGSVDPIFLKEYQRDELQQLIELLDQERITAVIGPRRVGKTTLMYQLIDHLLRSGTKKEHVLFISMDDPLVKMMDDPLKTIIDEYLEKVIKKPIREVEKLYVFIDEIHSLPDWTLWLKRYYDLKYNIKFIVTSSSATHLLKHSKESLVGRITELKVMPLNFRDFIKFKGRGDLLELYSEKDIFNLDVKDTIFELTKFQNELVLYFNEYILCGGYPEYHSAKDIRTWQNLLISDVVEKTIYRDIATLYKVKNPQYLENILTYIAQNNCQTTSHNRIAQALSISTDTVINMVYYLESTYFIGSLSLFSKNVKKRIRSNRKLFVIDSGLCNALLKTRSIKDENIGLLVESVVNSNMLALKESGQPIYVRDISYFTDKQKHEVDIVLNIGGKIVPLEVKYQNNIYDHDFKNLRYFMNAQDLGFGVIVTKNLFEMKRDILCIPAWIFLLIFADQVSYNLD